MKRTLKDSIDERVVPIKIGVALTALAFVVTASVWVVNAWRDLKEENRDLRKTVSWHTQALKNLHQTKPKEAATQP